MSDNVRTPEDTRARPRPECWRVVAEFQHPVGFPDVHALATRLLIEDGHDREDVRLRGVPGGVEVLVREGSL